MIELENIRKSFDGGQSFAIKNIYLTIKRAEILVLLGSSGSGKSTLLKMINRLITPTDGVITINQKNINAYKPEILRRKIGYVFQETGLFPHMTVAKNIGIVLQLMKKPRNVRLKRIRELLLLMQLEPGQFENRYPDELSGGQQQRVGVARALSADPDFLLMDEPFGALDPLTRETLQDELLRLNKQLNKTIVFVTHDLSEAFKLADRIAVMHQGACHQVGTKEQLIQRPASQFVATLMETENIICHA